MLSDERNTFLPIDQSVSVGEYTRLRFRGYNSANSGLHLCFRWINGDHHSAWGCHKRLFHPSTLPVDGFCIKYILYWGDNSHTNDTKKHKYEYEYRR
ncbi:hypothetical protein SAMD00023353_9000180 [Rosellinia necatrix]|uniref:Uncharacterized protein n=1 Tax=Rosellinia necatrix TaxID=77044 RepID=A0A1W2TW42_ROSNE|nr:hypothetical protein SAMD00023353_9000180 [Rosellinia necatrix]